MGSAYGFHVAVVRNGFRRDFENYMSIDLAAGIRFLWRSSLISHLPFIYAYRRKGSQRLYHDSCFLEVQNSQKNAIYYSVAFQLFCCRCRVRLVYTLARIPDPVRRLVLLSPEPSLLHLQTDC